MIAERFWAFQMVAISLGLGALLFYSMLYRAKLIPRFLSIWGLIGAIVVLTNSLLDMLGLPPGNLGVIMLVSEELSLLGHFHPCSLAQGAEFGSSMEFPG